MACCCGFIQIGRRERYLVHDLSSLEQVSDLLACLVHLVAHPTADLLLLGVQLDVGVVDGVLLDLRGGRWVRGGGPSVCSEDG